MSENRSRGFRAAAIWVFGVLVLASFVLAGVNLLLDKQLGQVGENPPAPPPKTNPYPVSVIITQMPPIPLPLLDVSELPFLSGLLTNPPQPWEITAWRNSMEKKHDAPIRRPLTTNDVQVLASELIQRMGTNAAPMVPLLCVLIAETNRTDGNRFASEVWEATRIMASVGPDALPAWLIASSSPSEAVRYLAMKAAYSPGNHSSLLGLRALETYERNPNEFEGHRGTLLHMVRFYKAEPVRALTLLRRELTNANFDISMAAAGTAAGYITELIPAHPLSALLRQTPAADLTWTKEEREFVVSMRPVFLGYLTNQYELLPPGDPRLRAVERAVGGFGRKELQDLTGFKYR